MSEILLCSVIDKLIDLLVQEAKSVTGIHREVKGLKDELEVIAPLLRDVEEKKRRGEMSETIKVWIQQIRDTAIEAENLVDEYRYHVMRSHRSGFVGSFWRASHFVKTLRPRHVVASKIRDAKESFREIRERGCGYGLRPLEPSGSTSSDTVDPRLSSLFIEEDELVGIESMTKELLENLVEGPATRVVISVVGEGGIGKTTLAKRVFDDEAVKRHFGSARIWITVSQQYSLKEVLKKIREKVTTEGEATREIDRVEELISDLRERLRAKRYVIVFDDVWEDHFWGKIKLALPRNNEGSRIIITTRSEIISDSCRESEFDIEKNLESWSKELAWELFCKKAFQQFQGNCPEELKQLSIKIVEKCAGLPLVISTIASLLARKEKVVSVWEKVLSDLNSKVEIDSQDTRRVEEILSLSYYDLPYFLRPCFLYFGLFPEDSFIDDERLYRLWIAEGFIKAKGDKTLEEVAAEYLGELVKRNMVAFHPPKYSFQAKFFGVHDLMHNVILSRAKEVCFCQTWDKNASLFGGNGRRITIPSYTKNILKKVESSKIRTLFLSRTAVGQSEIFFMRIDMKRYKFLEVLDVESYLDDRILKEIGKFFNLKFLSLKDTRTSVLPNSICNLQNLQSLDIRDTSIRQLPKNINKLVNLRHLLGHRMRVPERFGDLKDLQTLASVDATFGGDRFIQELAKLRKLRRLKLWVDRESGRALCTAIGKMNHLQRLTLITISYRDALDLEYLSSPPYSLQDLTLFGRLERSPEWIPCLSNLSRLNLFFSELGDEAIKSLEGLPNLESLELHFAYSGEQLSFEAGGFLKLKRLVLENLKSLKMVTIDQGALPLLERLRICGCSNLHKMPSLQYQKNLKWPVETQFDEVQDLDLLDFFPFMWENLIVLSPIVLSLT